MILQEKVALVTGAGGRLGRAVTNKLLAEGAALVLVDQDVSELSKMSASPDWIAPDALADVIALLCSPAARAIHGAGLQIAGRV